MFETISMINPTTLRNGIKVKITRKMSAKTFLKEGFLIMCVTYIQKTITQTKKLMVPKINVPGIISGWFVISASQWQAIYPIKLRKPLAPQKLRSNARYVEVCEKYSLILDSIIFPPNKV